MANSYTTTYSLTKPEVGAAEDQWGDLLNANLDAIDDLLDGTTAVTGIDINSGTIDGVTIGGTAAPTVTNIDINGGTIDGTVIGGASAAAVTGTTITGSGFVSTGNMSFGDNNKAIFGAGSDLQIYHDGTHSRIVDAGTGDLRLYGDNFQINSWSTAENYLTATTNGAVTLYYDNAAKLATTSTGVDVTGTVTADGLTVDGAGEFKQTSSGGEVKPLRVTNSSTTTGSSASLVFNLSTISADQAKIEAKRTNSPISSDTELNFYQVSNGVMTLRQKIATNGDISFYEDTGTTPKLFWDASAERLGIGTSSPIGKLDVSDGINPLSINSDVYNEIQSYNRPLLLNRQGNNVGIGTAAVNNSLQVQGNIGLNNSSGTQVALIAPSLGGSFRIQGQTTEPMSFWTNNTERLRIDASGNVGIGTSSPASKLNVVGDQIVISSSSGLSGLGLQIKNLLPALPTAQVQGYIGTGDSTIGVAGDLIIAPRTSVGASVRFITGTTPTERLRIDASGNVGIGTSSPAELVHVKGGVNGDGITLQRDSVTANDYAQLGFLVSTNDAGTPSAWVRGLRGALANQEFLTLGTANTERLRIDSSGNVGIRTTSPTADLQIGANPGSNRTFQMGSAGATRFVVSTDGVNGLTNIGCTNDSTTGRLAFRTGASLTERMRIDEIGNVGIGTSSPQDPLHVAGDIRMDNAGYIVSESNTGVGVRMLGINAVNSAYVGPIDSGPISVIFNASTTSVTSAFYTGGTERMRIDSSGNVGIGSTTPAVSATNLSGIGLYGAGQVNVSGVSVPAIDVNRKTTDGTIVQFRRQGTAVGSISVTTTATAYNTSSDYRLKEDVQPMVGASDRVLALKPSNFAWKADGSRTDGFIAHEVQEVAPYAVTGEKDGEDMQAMDHSKLVPLLTAALQEALTEIASLKARLDAANL